VSFAEPAAGAGVGDFWGGLPAATPATGAEGDAAGDALGVVEGGLGSIFGLAAPVSYSPFEDGLVSKVIITFTLVTLAINETFVFQNVQRIPLNIKVSSNSVQDVAQLTVLHFGLGLSASTSDPDGADD